jgi:hypothetical protein
VVDPGVNAGGCCYSLKGPLEQPILIDLGVARRIAAHPAARSGKTTHPEPAFTSLYGAPEQFDAASFGPPSARTDVFALALVLVELVTGKVALLDQRYHEISGPDIKVRWTAYQAALNQERRPTILALGVECDPALDRVLARALAVQQEERFADVTAFWLALCDSLGKDLNWGIKQLSSLPPPVVETPQVPWSSTIPGEPLLPGTSDVLEPPDRGSYGPGSTEPSDGFSPIPQVPRTSAAPAVPRGSSAASGAPGAGETPGSRSLSGALSEGGSGPSIDAPPEVMVIPGERPFWPGLLLATALGVALLLLGLRWERSSGEATPLLVSAAVPLVSASSRVSAPAVVSKIPATMVPEVPCRGPHMTGKKQGNGPCEKVSCDPGFGDCDPSREGCETATTSDAKNCGRCGHVCKFRPEAHVSKVRCADSTCRLASCEDGWMNCDGNERACSFDLRSDANNCGTCNHRCQALNASASCVNRTCQFTCNPGFACQDPEGNCKDTRSDVTCCGAAAAECRASNASARCEGGACHTKLL